jgi:hypothetical protein
LPVPLSCLPICPRWIDVGIRILLRTGVREALNRIRVIEGAIRAERSDDRVIGNKCEVEDLTRWKECSEEAKGDLRKLGSPLLPLPLSYATRKRGIDSRARKLDSPRLRVDAMLTGRRRNWKAAENPARIAGVSAIAQPISLHRMYTYFCVICAFP